MAKVKVKINSSTARAILRSPEVTAEITRRTEAIAQAACNATPQKDKSKQGLKNPPFLASVKTGQNRVRGIVSTANPYAIRSNAKNHTLLKSLDAGR